MTSMYGKKQSLYWGAQIAFRKAAIAEVQRLMPDTVARVILEMNYTPRLTVTDLLDVHGKSVLNTDTGGVIGGADDLFDRLDQIAADTESFEFDEASSFLFRYDDFRFYIERVETSK